MSPQETQLGADRLRSAEQRRSEEPAPEEQLGRPEAPGWAGASHRDCT